MHVRRHLAAAVLAPLLLLAACGEDDPEPQIPEPSATPTPTASESPSAAQESPEEFIRRYVEVEQAMENSGDSSAYRSLIDRRCKGCMQLADRVDDIYGAGGYVETRGWNIIRVDVTNEADDQASLDLTVQSSPTVFVVSEDARKQQYPGGRLKYSFRLVNEDAQWAVLNISEYAS